VAAAGHQLTQRELAPKLAPNVPGQDAIYRYVRDFLNPKTIEIQHWEG